eukprot:TRINITY_DN11392_c0_g1_i8.p1 TRINITY_DN11392_c0_g1~~TRINITY_DN11392_c0_g1_i8.p1  ORF type:complete len:234 (-),score=43.31 TRINITY_DN11392_c0_g1_i8:45-746(-)
MSGVSVKLRDLPEKGFTSQDQPYPRGEIMVKSRTMSHGYYHQPALTAAAFDADGYFHTGDLGTIDERGRIFILERVAAVESLSGGHIVCPNKLESIYESCSFVQHLYLHVNPDCSFLVGVLVPNVRRLQKWMSQHESTDEKDGKSETTDGESLESAAIRQALASPQLEQDILAEFTQLAHAKGLAEYEIPHALHLSGVEWSPQNGLLNIHFKKMRSKIARYYADTLKMMTSQN